MTLSKLSEKTLKIHLDKNDIAMYDLDYKNINVRTVRSILLELYDEISTGLNIDLEEEKLYVEVISRKHSCLIFVSLSRENRKNHGKNDCILDSYICEFEYFDDLRNFCESLYFLYPGRIKKSSLCCGSRTLRLLISLNAAEEGVFMAAADNRGVIIPFSGVNVGVTGEYYTELIPTDAIDAILSVR